MPQNRKITLAKRPDGMPEPSDFSLVEEVVGEAPADHVLVQVDTLSVDAFIRTMLDERDVFHGVTPIGGPVVALGVGRVIESSSSEFTVGEWVSGPMMAQTHAILPAAMLNKIDPASNIPPSTYLGLLGLTTGITAWVGMRAVGNVQAGQVVVVSGAAGAVGSVAGQVAKARGATVFGIAGGPEKCEFLVQTLGLDGAIDYKNEDVDLRLKALAPKGIDLFFDNVGGQILDAALDNLAVEGSVVICGAVSQYQHLEDVQGPNLYLRLAERNATMRGFTVDHYPQCFEEASAELGTWMADGQVTLPEHEISGIEKFPEALIALLSGGHMGKMLVVA